MTLTPIGPHRSVTARRFPTRSGVADPAPHPAADPRVLVRGGLAPNVRPGRCPISRAGMGPRRSAEDPAFLLGELLLRQHALVPQVRELLELVHLARVESTRGRQRLLLGLLRVDRGLLVRTLVLGTGPAPPSSARGAPRLLPPHPHPPPHVAASCASSGACRLLSSRSRRALLPTPPAPRPRRQRGSARSPAAPLPSCAAPYPP